MQPDAVERLLVANGLPQLVKGWSARTHVLPRMLPGLAFYLGALVAAIFLPLESWDMLWMAVGGSCAAALTWVACRPLRERRHVMPRWAALAVPPLFVLAPALIVVADYAKNGAPAYMELSDGLEADPAWAAAGLAVTLAVGAALWLVLCCVGVNLGVVALIRIAAKQSLTDLKNSGKLHGRAMPSMLFVTFLAFLSAEVWQLGDHISWKRLTLVLLLFALVTVIASASHLRDELEDAKTASALSGGAHWNLLTVLATRQLVQATVVGLGVFVFFTVLGVIAVDPATAKIWVGATPKPSHVLGVPQALLRCAALLAGFGAMNFAVSTMTNSGDRADFFRPIVADLKDLVARTRDRGDA
ncbi:hypothetical protein [Nonomuraea soli]|uniref:Uncharacterized protein n=1 Tax=Nonomuraea soli TaxID=1032476 RepID=A0A7W0CPV7_9ACTN|nr:hypothetical protein [Nonomuraea soli]MBA2895080.1 hypothetical protein [Nonomuraea soli]